MNVYVLGLITFLNASSIGVIIPVMFNYASSFGLNDVLVGLLFATFPFAQFLATPVIGRLSDRYGRKILLVISLLGTFLASLIQAFATNGWMLFFGRFLDGITGGNTSVVQAAIADSAKNKDKTFGFALSGAAHGLGFLFGTLLALFISRTGNFYVFMSAAILALIATVITLFFLPETNLYRETKPLNVVELVFLEIFRAFKLPVVRDILIISLVTGISLMIFQVTFQPYIIRNFGYGQDEITLVLILNGLMSIAFLGLKWIVDKFGLILLLKLTFLLRLLVFLILALIIDRSVFWGAMLILAFTNLVSRPVISNMISNYARREDQGAAMGVAESMYSIGLIIGPSIFSIATIPLNNGLTLESEILNNVLISTANNYTLPFYLMALISLITYVHVIKFTKKIE
jgi:MFS family permease